MLKDCHKPPRSACQAAPNSGDGPRAPCASNRAYHHPRYTPHSEQLSCGLETSPSVARLPGSPGRESPEGGRRRKAAFEAVVPGWPPSDAGSGDWLDVH